MSLPSIFEYLPEQAALLCKVAGRAPDPRPYINLVPGVAAIGGGITGGMEATGFNGPFMERSAPTGSLLGGIARGAAGAGLGSIAGLHVGDFGGAALGAFAGLGGAGPAFDTEAHMAGGAEGGRAVGRLAGGVAGAMKGYRLAMPSQEKTAEESEPTPGQKVQGVAKTIGTGLAGFGAGSLAGAGGALLLDKWHEAATGQKIPLSTLYKTAPIVGGAMGLAYNIYKARELEELRRALANKPDRPQGRVSPK